MSRLPGWTPVSRQEFWEILDRLSEQGITILVSTAYMDEANRCTRISLMQAGRFMATDTPKGITESYDELLWSVEGNGCLRCSPSYAHTPT